MILLVCGGRKFMDFVKVRETLDAIHTETPITLVIHGGAQGADGIAGWWADKREVPKQVFPAKWSEHGKAAGPIRNDQMLARNPDLVVAFPGGKGTAHMVRIAKAKGTKVLEVE